MARIIDFMSISIKGRTTLRPTSDTDVMIKRELVKKKFDGNVGKEITLIRKLFMKVWLDTLIEWLLEQNEYKIRSSFIMRIVNRDNTNKNYRYDIKNRGIQPILFVKTSTKHFEKIRRYYLAALNPKFQELLDERTKRGIEYVPLTQTNYVNFK